MHPKHSLCGTTFSSKLNVSATITYRLTATYEHCESDYALTPDGEDYVIVEVTGIEENTKNNIVTVLNVFNMSGQRIQANNMDELNTGVYIIQGLTEDGRLVSRKMVVDRTL